MEIVVAGVSSRAPLEAREAVSLPGDLSRRMLLSLRRAAAFDEALVLNTCNRTEVCLVTNGRHWSPKDLLSRISRLKASDCAAAEPYFDVRRGLSAVDHLFRVAASLDSQLVGEHEILGQLKDAYRLSVETRASGFFLNRLLHRAFRVGGRVRCETSLCRGAASVPSAAVETARHLLGTLSGQTALIVGAGMNARLAARALLRCGVASIIIANRTRSNAERLAKELRQPWSGADGAFGPEPADDGVFNPADPAGPAAYDDTFGSPVSPPPSADAVSAPSIRAVPLAAVPSVIAEADLVIASTMSPHYVLTAAALAGPLSARARPLVIIDSAVPRDVDPAIGAFPGVRLVNIDSLDRVVAENIARRRAEIPRAESIVAQEVVQFGKWLESLRVVPTIRLLEEHLALLESDELRKVRHKFRPEDRRRLELFARRLCRKLLHEPISFLRESSAGHADSAARAASTDAASIALIQRMFNLKPRGGQD